MPSVQRTVDVVIPVYNEERTLPKSIATLCGFLETLKGYQCTVVIANNGSTDDTLDVARELAAENPRVRILDVGRKGRGFALRRAWTESSADMVTYMDVDLSTHLEAFPVLLAALDAAYDVVIGSRLFRASRTVRSRKREILSRGYNALLKLVFWNGFRDAQCGFKGLRREVAQRLLPEVVDDGWFFDTELLLLAEATDHRIMEVPVGWIEDLDSRVELVRTILGDLRGIARLRLGLPQAARRIRRLSSASPGDPTPGSATSSS